jgi:23S rRNA pseudouridine1911/1915/1917 synthase
METSRETIEAVVDVARAGERLDRFLAVLPAVGSRAEAERLIASGAVTVDGCPARKSRVLKVGQRVTLWLTTRENSLKSVPAVDFTIIHEDEYLIVVDKPAGLVVHPAPGNRSGTLSQALANVAAGGDPQRPGIVHRLDKDTSGLLIVARSDQVLRDLQGALKERRIRRLYTALVRGRPESRSGTIDAPLGRDRRDPERIAVREASSRHAVTHFEVIEPIGARTLLEVALETGRTHQIRVHLAAIDLPVCGDRKYGVADDLGLKRQFLHAGCIDFVHPVTKQRLELVSELPSDLADALEAARRER